MFEATRWSPEGWCNATQSRRLILLTTVGSPQTGVHQHNKRRQWIEPHPYEQLHSKKTRETTNKENYKVTTILLPTKDANIPRAPHWRVKKKRRRRRDERNRVPKTGRWSRIRDLTDSITSTADGRMLRKRKGISHTPIQFYWHGPDKCHLWTLSANTCSRSGMSNIHSAV